MLQYASNRDILDRFEQPSVRLSVEADLDSDGTACGTGERPAEVQPSVE
jgi:hypothetical protein